MNCSRSAAGTLVLLVATSACGVGGSTLQEARSAPVTTNTGVPASTSAAPISNPAVVTEPHIASAVVAAAALPVPVVPRARATTRATTRAAASPAPKPAPTRSPAPAPVPVPVPVPKPAPHQVVEPAPKPAPPRVIKPAPQPAPAAATSGCNSNYTPCVPDDPKDVDCQGGSGNGPSYVKGPVRVTGTDVYGLDADKNGIGCE